MVNFCAVVGCTNKAKKGNRKSFFRLSAVINHLGEKDRELSKRRQDAWLARMTRSEASELRDHLCVLRSLCHRETSQIVRYHTSGLGAVAEFGVQREDQ